MRDPLKDAISDLADEQRSRQFPDPITAAQALEHVDAKLTHAWLVQQLARQSHLSILLEVIETQINVDTAGDALAALVNRMGAHPDSERFAGDVFAQKFVAALRGHIAADLAYEASKAVENWEPTDSEMARGSYASWVDDPVIGDRRAIAQGAR